jgi:hypothetical protein
MPSLSGIAWSTLMETSYGRSSTVANGKFIDNSGSDGVHVVLLLSVYLVILLSVYLQHILLSLSVAHTAVCLSVFDTYCSISDSYHLCHCVCPLIQMATLPSPPLWALLSPLWALLAALLVLLPLLV